MSTDWKFEALSQAMKRIAQAEQHVQAAQLELDEAREDYGSLVALLPGGIRELDLMKQNVKGG